MKSLHWYRVEAEVNCDGEQLEHGFVYIKATTLKDARVGALNYVDSTWGTTDPRIDYGICAWGATKIDENTEQTHREFFNRPESVFTAQESLV